MRTRRRSTVRLLLRENRRLRHRLKAKDQAVHLMAHELKGGLHKLGLLAQLAQLYHERGDVARAGEKLRELRDLTRLRNLIIERWHRAVTDA